MIDEMGTGRLRGRSGASRSLPALGLGGLFARRRFLGRSLCLRLPARENLDLSEAGDDELDRVALLAALIFPGARTHLTDEPQARTHLHGLLDQCDFGGGKHHNTMPDPMRSGKQPTQTPYGC